MCQFFSMKIKHWLLRTKLKRKLLLITNTDFRNANKSKRKFLCFWFLKWWKPLSVISFSIWENLAKILCFPSFVCVWKPEAEKGSLCLLINIMRLHYSTCYLRSRGFRVFCCPVFDFFSWALQIALQPWAWGVKLFSQLPCILFSASEDLGRMLLSPFWRVE